MKRVACWSGPRNVSTALMRSWSSRNDTFVSDEPLYAYYLKKTKLKHPMYSEIINYYPNNLDDIIFKLTTENIHGKKIWYQKHMAHHLIDLNKIDWIRNFHNCFLIRDPLEVIHSYSEKHNLKVISIDKEKLQIGCSIKQLSPDPFEHISNYEIGFGFLVWACVGINTANLILDGFFLKVPFLV